MVRRPGQDSARRVRRGSRTRRRLPASGAAAVPRSLQVRAISRGQVMKVLVYGSRLFGQVVRCLVDDCGHEFAGFIDDSYEGEDVLGPFASVRQTCSPSDYVCVNAVGYSDLTARRGVTARIRDAKIGRA